MSFLRWLIVVPVLALFSACHGEPASADVAQTADADSAGSVWVVDSPSTGGRLFLCGTIHILRTEDYPLPAAYDVAFRQTDKLVLELPPGAGAGSALGDRMRELGTYPDNASLKGAVGQELWQRVETWAGRRKLDAAALNRYRPWFVALIITSTEYAVLGAQQHIGVDQHFEERAAAQGKPAEGLETVEFQLQLFTGLSADQQKQMLEQTLDEIATLPKEFETMIAAWKQGKLDVLGDMLFREAERFPELMELFLINRNKAWIPRLDEMLRKGDKAMILVGAGHLASDNGLIQLLKDRGYSVRYYRDEKDLQLPP